MFSTVSKNMSVEDFNKRILIWKEELKDVMQSMNHLKDEQLFLLNMANKKWKEAEEKLQVTMKRQEECKTQWEILHNKVDLILKATKELWKDLE